MKVEHINSGLGLIAAILIFAAAFISNSEKAPPWIFPLLGLAGILGIGVLVWRPVTAGVSRLVERWREGRQCGGILKQVSDIARRLSKQMSLEHMDNIVFHLFNLNTAGGPFRDCPVPHTGRAQISLDELVELIERWDGNLETAKHLLALFDWMFALYNEQYFKGPVERALKVRDALERDEQSRSSLRYIRQYRPRYDMLIENYRTLCETTKATLRLDLGHWCYEVPPPL